MLYRKRELKLKKVVLVGVNAKFIHTNLGIRSLKCGTDRENVVLCEVTINDQLSKITEKLIRLEGDCYGFSCYIWNMEMILKICEVLKKSKPECCIFLGGPEVSYDSNTLLKKYPNIDYILAGEGEIIFPQFLAAFDKDQKNILDSIGRKANGELAIVEHLDKLPFPYTEEDLEEHTKQIVYYESMRGCPFKCSYCLSSTLKNVRYLPLERVYTELDFFIDHGVKQVKFVDRTFNVDIKRTKALMSYLIKRGGNTNFHFEISGDLLDEELLELISQAPVGLMQFEIGIQSTDENTLASVTRKTDLQKIEHSIRTLIQMGNAHVHVDLIAGLPYETYAIFKKSFNETIALEPDMLQLGFLKLLKGTRIRLEAEKYGYVYTSFPPYEVIANNFISAGELLVLKDIEELLERYYNSDDFKMTIQFIFDREFYGTPFDFFESYSKYWHKHNYYEMGQSKDKIYSILQDYILETVQGADQKTLLELLKFDYLYHGNRSLPPFFKEHTLRKEKAFEFLKNTERAEMLLPEMNGETAKQKIKKVVFQYFDPKTLEIVSGFLRKTVEADQVKNNLCLFYDGKYVTTLY